MSWEDSLDYIEGVAREYKKIDVDLKYDEEYAAHLKSVVDTAVDAMWELEESRRGQ